MSYHYHQTSIFLLNLWLRAQYPSKINILQMDPLFRECVLFQKEWIS